MIGRWTVVNAILVVVILALGAQIARTWMRTLPPTRVETAGGDKDVAARRPSRRNKAGSSGDATTVVAAIAAKNLFDPTRSGDADAVVADAPPAEPPPPPGVVVVGVRMIGPDTEAVVEETAPTKEQRRVREGDSIGEYTVEEIRDTSIVLSAESGESVTLWLEVGAGEKTVPPKPNPVRPVTPRTAPVQATGTAAQRAATRRAQQRKARRRARNRRARQGNAQLPQGVRERLEALRRDR